MGERAAVVQGQWYGDSPDNEPATNPFDNTQIKKESE